MSTTTTPRRTGCLLAVALTALFAIAACTRADGAPPASLPPTTASSSEGTTPPSVTPSTTATTETTETTETTTTAAAPVPSDCTRTRAPSEVSIALLDTNSFVAGVHVVPIPNGGASSSGAGAGGSGTTVTSSNPKCAAFVSGPGPAGTVGAKGVTGYASIAFQDDGDPAPFLVEEIITVGTAEHAAEALAALDGATHGCTRLTMKVPGVGSSTMTVTPATPPAHGDHATAAHILGATGPMNGLHIAIVATGVQDAVLLLTFFQESESDIQGITESAVTRATAVFTSAKPS